MLLEKLLPLMTTKIPNYLQKSRMLYNRQPFQAKIVEVCRNKYNPSTPTKLCSSDFREYIDLGLVEVTDSIILKHFN